jgi:hypothetical protein
MKRDPKLYCPHCAKPLTPGEMCERWCESCERPTDKPADKEAA